jgi:small GTP-binding protein
MAMPERPTAIKILLIGPSSSGKTSLTKRYVDDVFEPDDTTTTIGVDFREKKITRNKKAYRLLIHDTAGQEYAALSLLFLLEEIAWV